MFYLRSFIKFVIKGDPTIGGCLLQTCLNSQIKLIIVFWQSLQSRIKGGPKGPNHQEGPPTNIAFRKNDTGYIVITRNWLCFSLSLSHKNIEGYDCFR